MRILKEIINLEEKLETAESKRRIFENPQEEALSILFSFGGLVYNDMSVYRIYPSQDFKHISPGDPSHRSKDLKV